MGNSNRKQEKPFSNQNLKDLLSEIKLIENIQAKNKCSEEAYRLEREGLQMMREQARLQARSHSHRDYYCVPKKKIRKKRKESTESTEENIGWLAGLPAGATSPGLLRYLHTKSRSTIPQCFEGGYVDVKMRPKPAWTMGHRLSLSSVSPGGYRFQGAYTGDGKGNPYALFEADPSGNVNAELRGAPTESTRASLVGQVSDGKLASCESTLDAFFEKWTASAMLVNGETLALHWLAAVGASRELAVGAEAVLQRSGVSEKMSAVTGAVRWSHGPSTLSATLGTRAMEMCYYHRVAPHIAVSAMLEIGFSSGSSLATVSYRYAGAGWALSASAHSDGLVGAALEHHVPLRRAHLTAALSGLANHWNDKFRLGFGVTAYLE